MNGIRWLYRAARAAYRAWRAYRTARAIRGASRFSDFWTRYRARQPRSYETRSRRYYERSSNRAYRASERYYRRADTRQVMAMEEAFFQDIYDAAEKESDDAKVAPSMSGWWLSQADVTEGQQALIDYYLLPDTEAYLEEAGMDANSGAYVMVAYASHPSVPTALSQLVEESGAVLEEVLAGLQAEGSTDIITDVEVSPYSFGADPFGGGWTQASWEASPWG